MISLRHVDVVCKPLDRRPSHTTDNAYRDKPPDEALSVIFIPGLRVIIRLRRMGSPPFLHRVSGRCDVAPEQKKTSTDKAVEVFRSFAFTAFCLGECACCNTSGCIAEAFVLHDLRCLTRYLVAGAFVFTWLFICHWTFPLPTNILQRIRGLLQ